MITFTDSVLRYGRNDPLPEPLALHAGPLTLHYEEGSLRNLRIGSHEVIHQIYSAVRDHNWGTVPGTLQDLQIDQQADSFRIGYRSEHRRQDIHFVWTGTITGAPDGTVTFSMAGEALSTFKRNRIGFCVLHPMACAGQTCTVEQVNGETYASRFPELIAPHQPFMNLRAITYEVMPGVRGEVRMEGDVFEMEDQRNWTDASYKTYCTPLGLPFPVLVKAGTKISQVITLRIVAPALRVEPSGEGVRFIIQEQAEPLPRLGLGIASHGLPLSEMELERLQALHLSHLRTDVRFKAPNWADHFRQSAAEAKALNAGLEIALHLTANAETDLAAIRTLAETLKPAIDRWLVFRDGEKSTTARWITLAREQLGALGAPLVTGTDAYFTELNRNRPPVDVADGVVYSVNPQVHAFDNTSLAETVVAQGETVRSTRAFVGSLPICVGPVTLKIRWNPDATGPDPLPAPGELPPQVDARQMSLFGAGWTVGSIKHLAQSGAASITYFETTGWRGVMETAAGSPLPEKFCSVPGGVYPMYHVFADVGEFQGGEVLTSHSSDTAAIEGIALLKEGRLRVLLANLSPHEQTVEIPDVHGKWTVKSLDHSNAEFAMRDPEGFRAQPGQVVQAEGSSLRVTLAPYALARLDHD